MPPHLHPSENKPLPGQSTGKLMLYIGWLMALGGLTLFFGEWGQQQHNPNQNPESQILQHGVREVSLLQNDYHHYVANGFIQHHPVTFLLDTGASHVVIPETLAKKLHLQKGVKTWVQTANGTIEVYSTRLDSLEIGVIKLFNVRASINPSMSEKEDVLLGMSVLKELEFIQNGESLTLRQHPK